MIFEGSVAAIADQGLLLPAAALLHGAAGSWDEIALLLLAPLVVAALLWVTRRPPAEDADESEPPAADPHVR